MDTASEAIRAALRVLTAVMHGREPEPVDVEILKAYIPDSANCPVDELACDAVEQVLKAKAAARPAAK